MSNVTTHARFVGRTDAAEQILRDIREQGTDIVVLDDAADVILAEPQFGETLLGDLLDSEKALFVALYRTQQELEAKARDYVGAAIERMGTRIRTSDLSKPINQAIADGEVSMDFGSAENKEAFFRLQQRAAVLHANLYWSLGERFASHGWSIGVRTRFRAVRVRERA